MHIVRSDVGRDREVVMLSIPEARNIGDAIAVALIRSRDEMSGDLLRAALDELVCAFGGGAPIGWRCLT